MARTHDCEQESILVESVVCDMCGANNSRIVATGNDFEYRTSDMDFSFVECLSCGLVYLQPRPVASECARIYPPEYSPHNFAGNRQLAVRLRRLREVKKAQRAYLPLVSDRKAARILDYGCGDGSLMSVLRRCAPAGCDIAGYDIDEQAVAAARQKGLNAYGPSEFASFAKGSRHNFDLVIANQLIEHVPSPTQTIGEITNLMSDDGILSLETPNMDCWDRSVFGSTWDGYHFPRHWTLFTKRTIERLLHQCGYTRVAFQDLVSPNIWVKSIKNALMRKWGIPYEKLFHKYNPVLLGIFTTLDLLQIASARSSSNMRVVACRKGT